MGAGAAKRLSAVRWGVAGNIVAAWVLTLPCSAAVGALTYGVVQHLRQRLGRARSWSSRCWLLGAARVLRAPAVRRRRAGGGHAMRLRVVEVGQIFEVIWVSLVAGVGITMAYSFVVLGTGRSAEARRAGRGGAAIAYGAWRRSFLVAVRRRRRARRRRSCSTQRRRELLAGVLDRPQHPGGRAGRDRERRQVGRDDGVGADHAALADRDAAGDDDVGAAPDVVADPGGALGREALPGAPACRGRRSGGCRR